MKWFFFLVLFLMSFVSAIETDFDCPESVAIDEEFPCSLVVKDIEGAYDIKVEIIEEGVTIAKILNPLEEKWQSAYYYLKEFIKKGEKKEVYLKIEKEGNFNGILKLRQGSKISSFDFEIKVIEKELPEEKPENIYNPQIKQELTQESPEKKSTISLNNFNESTLKTQLIYESKNYKLIKYLPYIFSLLLVFIIIILIWDKF
jgi:hypothetical protein